MSEGSFGWISPPRHVSKIQIVLFSQQPPRVFSSALSFFPGRWFTNTSPCRLSSPNISLFFPLPASLSQLYYLSIYLLSIITDILCQWDKTQEILNKWSTLQGEHTRVFTSRWGVWNLSESQWWQLTLTSPVSSPNTSLLWIERLTAEHWITPEGKLSPH